MEQTIQRRQSGTRNSRLAQHHQVLLAIAGALNTTSDLESLWRTVSQQLRRIIPWERASILLYMPEADAFQVSATETCVPHPTLKRDTLIPRVGSALGWVREHRKVLIRSDLHRRRVFLEDDYYAQEGHTCAVNVPLLVRETCLGCMTLCTQQDEEPTPAEVDFLCQAAIPLAHAIETLPRGPQPEWLPDPVVSQKPFLPQEINPGSLPDPMVGTSEGIRRALALASAVAPANTTVLITGETGTGKELLARAIHTLSPRCDKPFIRVNCAALPPGLVESELFGHERGAFTGAYQRHLGRFELAHGGTLFLDEIGELSLEAQAKLLRVLEDRELDRIGGTRSIPVDVRVIAATNADLVKAVAEGRFRSDLFFRLNVFPISLPPLRDRREDIPLLARHFLEQCRAKIKKPCQDIEPRSLARLCQYDWPGNVRELQNVIERAAILARSPIVEIDDSLLKPMSEPGQSSGGPRAQTLEEIERQHIHRVLEQTQWRIYGPHGAAARLGLNPSTLRSRLKKLGLKRPDLA